MHQFVISIFMDWKDSSKLSIYNSKSTVYLHNIINSILFPPVEHFYPHLESFVNVKLPSLQKSAARNPSFLQFSGIKIKERKQILKAYIHKRMFQYHKDGWRTKIDKDADSGVLPLFFYKAYTFRRPWQHDLHE